MNLKLNITILILLFTPLAFSKIPCDDCEYQNECLKIGTQKLTKEGGYEIYCSSNKKIERAKEDNQACNNHYECRSYYCNENICSPITHRKKAKNIFKVILIPIVLIFLSVGLFFFFKKTKLVKVKKTKISKTKPVFKPVKYSYKPVKRKFSRFSSLEKQLQQIKK